MDTVPDPGDRAAILTDDLDGHGIGGPAEFDAPDVERTLRVAAPPVVANVGIVASHPPKHVAGASPGSETGECMDGAKRPRRAGGKFSQTGSER